MKRLYTFLLTLLIVFCSYANEFHYYFTMNSEGTVTKYEISENAYTVTINNIIRSLNRYISCDITLHCPHSADKYVILRRHSNGNPGNENDPLWNMQTQPEINPLWCSYEVLESSNSGCIIRFVDTFPESLYLNENPTANALKYYVKDKQTGHTLDIWIMNIFYYDIITNIDKVLQDNNVIYYNVNGLSSDKPFKGINIVKRSNNIYKLLKP